MFHVEHCRRVFRSFHSNVPRGTSKTVVRTAFFTISGEKSRNGRKKTPKAIKLAFEVVPEWISPTFGSFCGSNRAKKMRFHVEPHESARSRIVGLI
jgi:hypothetical protein